MRFMQLVKIRIARHRADQYRRYAARATAQERYGDGHFYRLMSDRWTETAERLELGLLPNRYY